MESLAANYSHSKTLLIARPFTILKKKTIIDVCQVSE